MSTIYDAGTSEQILWKLAMRDGHELAVAGIGDTVQIIENGAPLNLTAVELNPKDIDESVDKISPNKLVSISVSS